MSVILDEFYVPQDLSILDVLKESPDAREIYQLTLRDFLEDIRSILELIRSPIEEISIKFEDVKRYLETQDPTLANSTGEFQQLVSKKKNELEPIFDRLSQNSVRSFSGYNLNRDQEIKLRNYLSSFRSRMVSMITHRLRTPYAVLGTSSYLIDKILSLQPDNFNDSRLMGKTQVISSALGEYQEIFVEIEKFYNICFALDRNSVNVEWVPSENLPYLFLDLLDEPTFQGLNLSVNNESEATGIKIDVEHIKEAVRQILINSIDFSNRGSDLAILVNIRTVNQEQKRLVIEITDNGAGIKPQELQNVFEPFYTQDMVGIDFANLPGTGCGLGLSIAKGLVERYGEIGISSVLNQGTTVVLDFKARD